MKTSALVFDAVSVCINGKLVLSDISLTLPARSFVSVIGSNGAGKSTLLRSVVRLVTSTGEIYVKGNVLSSFSQRRLAAIVAYVPQSEVSDCAFTVREIIGMGRYAHLSRFGGFAKRDLLAIEQALEVCGLHPLERRTVSSLSGGERRKVALAAALAQETEILLLDEPATFLDPAIEEELYQILIAVRSKRKVSILLVTHDVNRAALVSEKIIALKNGKIIFEGSPELCMCPEVLERVFETAFTYVRHPESPLLMLLPSVEPK